MDPILGQRYCKAFDRLDQVLWPPTVLAHPEKIARKTYGDLQNHILLACNNWIFGEQSKIYEHAAEQWERTQRQMNKAEIKARELAKLLAEDLPRSWRRPRHSTRAVYGETSQISNLPATGSDEFIRKGKSLANLNGSPVLRYAPPVKEGPMTKNPHVNIGAIVDQASAAAGVRLVLQPSDKEYCAAGNKLLARILEQLADQLMRRSTAGAFDFELAMALGPIALAGGPERRPLVGISSGLPSQGVLLAAQLDALLLAYSTQGYCYIPFDRRTIPAGRRSDGSSAIVQTFVETAMGLAPDDAAKCVESAKKFWTGRKKLPRTK